MFGGIGVVLFLLFLQGLVQLLIGSPVHQRGRDFPILVDPASKVLEFRLIFPAILIRRMDPESAGHKHGETDDRQTQGQKSCQAARFQAGPPSPFLLIVRVQSLSVSGNIIIVS